MPDTVLLGENAADHIHLIAGGHGDEDVRVADVRVIHRNRARAVREDRQHIQRVLHRFELVLVVIHDDDIELLLREQVRDAVPQLARTYNNDTQENLPLYNYPVLYHAQKARERVFLSRAERACIPFYSAKSSVER